MNKSFLSAVAVALLCLLPAAPLRGQAPPNVAVIDLAAVFKEHVRFKAMQEALKPQVEQAEADLQNEKQQIADLQERMKDFTSGSNEYKQLEEQAVNRTAALNARLSLQRKEFQQKEAANYKTVYDEIVDEVGYLAQRHNIQLVLRYNQAPDEVKDPQKVMLLLNKPVVYHDQRIDITQIIIESLNNRQGNPPVGSLQVPRRQ